VPQYLQPLHGRLALPAGELTKTRPEQAILRLQLAILVPQAGQLTSIPSVGNGLPEQEQSLLTSTLSTQNHGSNDQCDGCPKDIHSGTLQKKKRRRLRRRIVSYDKMPWGQRQAHRALKGVLSPFDRDNLPHGLIGWAGTRQRRRLRGAGALSQTASAAWTTGP
jgi:hypothetical protein